MSNDITNSNVRIAVAPLPYERITLAKDRELLCDYNKGKIYIKNHENIYDITSKIKETLIAEGMSINNCTVFIPNVGTIEIGDALGHIMQSLINITDIGSESGELVTGFGVDFMSITNKNKKIQIAGFFNAPDNTTPVKLGDTLTWLPYGSGGGGGDITIYDVEPEGRILQLLSKQIQRTGEFDTARDLDAYPPISGTPYLLFKWRLDVGEFPLHIFFQENVVFEYADDATVDTNSTYIFEFVTYNYGQSWLVKKTKYNQDTFANFIVGAVSDHIYTKDEVNAMLSWLTPEDITEEDEGPTSFEGAAEGAQGFQPGPPIPGFGD